MEIVSSGEHFSSTLVDGGLLVTLRASDLLD